MSYVKWIKILVDIFEDEKILLIESMPEADGIIVIWFKILCLAGRINNGGTLLLREGVPYTEEMLATIFRRPVNTIRLALSTFERFGMVARINGEISIVNWNKHQSLEKVNKRNEYMKNYMREYRKKEVHSKGEEKVNKLVNKKLNVKPLEEELEREEELDIYKEIVLYLNKETGKSFRVSTKATQRMIQARLNEGFKLDDFKKVIDTKVGAWIDDEKMSNYLRPATLFGTKFEGYLNEKPAGKVSKIDYGW